MATGIQIRGLKEVQHLLGKDFKPAMRNASEEIAKNVSNEMQVYPPFTIANQPSNPTGRWYKRLSGPRWRRKDGTIGGRDTSQVLGQSWTSQPKGMIGYVVGTTVTYAPFVQSADKQSRWMRNIGWQTDKQVLEKLVMSGKVKRIIINSIMAVLRRR